MFTVKLFKNVIQRKVEYSECLSNNTLCIVLSMLDNGKHLKSAGFFKSEMWGVTGNIKKWESLTHIEIIIIM